MNRNKNKTEIILLSILVLTTLIVVLPSINNSTLKTSKEKSIEKLLNSSYYNNSALPIYINGSDTGSGAHNWLWAATQPWCSGSGVKSDPYVIENLKINGNNKSNCIEIVDSDAYFVVRNCTLYNSSFKSELGYDAGINLRNVSNGILCENNCSYNGYYGILLNISCNNNIIKNNIIHENAEGIVLAYWSCFNLIEENNVYDNWIQGIILAWVSNFNNISNNFLTNNSICGIGVVFSSGFNRFQNNLITESQWGICLLWGIVNCTIFNNRIYDNLQYGIWLDIGGGNHSIIENSIVNNTLCGINITQGEGNSIYSNSFVNPNYNAYDNGFLNVWDNGSYGNFWNDYYYGVDSDYDGIGDVPYNISISPIIQDNHPIMNSIPSADLSVNASRIIVQQAVQLNCEYSGGNGHLSFSWNFGDGFSSSEQNPTHQYLISGNHTVTLKIMDVNRDTCIENIYIFVEIDMKPIPDFYLNESKVKVGKIVLFTYNGTDGNDPFYFEWDFGDNTTSMGRVTEHQFDIVGIYEIKLTVTDGNGDWANKTMILRVIDGYTRNEPLFLIAVISILTITIGISIIGIGILITKRKNKSLSDSITPSKSSRTPLLNNLPDPNDRINKPKKPSITPNHLQANHLEDIETKRKEIEETESQMGIVKPKIICIVHKGPIIGPSYICPKCETFYCMNCARVLKTRGESCWSCKLTINL